jgi:dipeptidyl aminopeptidase/acylaminoacyl peptidase
MVTRAGQTLLALLFALCVVVPLRSARASAACEDIVDRPAGGKAMRPITGRDLAMMRDIGSPQRPSGESPLGVAPDGRHVAFVVTRGMPETNSYCLALVILAIKPGASPVIADNAEELLLEPIEVRGLKTDYGYPALVRPVWSPDGRWVAWLKRRSGRAELWRARSDGSEARQIPADLTDITLLAWSPDGRIMVRAAPPDGLKSGPDEPQPGGYLFDDRVVPYNGSRPMNRFETVRMLYSIQPETGQTKPVSKEEERAFAVDGSGHLLSARTGAGRPQGWTAQRSGDGLLRPVDLWGLGPEGRSHLCAHPACDGGTFGNAIEGLWSNPDGRHVIFLHREGWARSQMALYRWLPGHAPQRLLLTDDVLAGCAITERGLLCLREGSRSPRHLVLLDPDTGAETLLFDPNPAFAGLALGKVERIRWRNAQGLECFGDLVLPTGYQTGQKVPLIVVQYRSRGFLRGGSGDEFPIFPFAARGFAVLNVNNPEPYFTLLGPGSFRTVEEIQRAHSKDWAERRSIHSALMTGISEVASRGIILPGHIGLTGLSDGAATLQYALVNEPGFFAAASVSACCIEPTGMMIYGGTALADERRSWGFPEPSDVGAWKPLSLVLNAETIRAPLLMQMADHGYLIALDAFMALRAKGRPVEMHVFPDEYHLKWQPAHRLAVYERNLDWFDFWLRGHIDDDPLKAGQYHRWEALREAR